MVQQTDINLPKRVKFLQKIIDTMKYKTYLEIGCRYGETLSNLKNIDSRVGIDPEALRRDQYYTDKGFCFIYHCTSDEYFKTYGMLHNSIDLIFIDGLHRYEQVIKDVKNSLSILSDKGLIVLHDCNPPSAEAAEEDYDINGRREWCGDVWKIIPTYRENSFVVDYDYGMGILTKTEPKEFDKNIAKMTYEDKDMNLGLASMEYFHSWLEDISYV